MSGEGLISRLASWLMPPASGIADANNRSNCKRPSTQTVQPGSIMYRGRYLNDMPVTQLRRLLVEVFDEELPSDVRRSELILTLAQKVQASNHGPLAPPPHSIPEVYIYIYIFFFLR